MNNHAITYIVFLPTVIMEFGNEVSFVVSGVLY
jgi:hypothetical protein